MQGTTVRNITFDPSSTHALSDICMLQGDENFLLVGIIPVHDRQSVAVFVELAQPEESDSSKLFAMLFGKPTPLPPTELPPSEAQ